MARLPGTVPIEMSDWLVRDEAFAGQMVRSDELISTDREAVAALDGVEDQSTELLDLILAQLKRDDGYVVGSKKVQRPDGIEVDLTADHPLIVARRLIQEDLLIHEKRGDVHRLVGGVLAFPASWSLAEKMGRDLVGIHEPVAQYDENVAKRVQRLFDGIRPGSPIMRANYLCYRDAELFQPRREAGLRDASTPSFMRVERQCLLKLAKSGAVVFTIHTYVVPFAKVDAAALEALPPDKLK